MSLPNLISLLRLPLAVAFPLAETPTLRAAVVLTAWISDWTDGVLARRRGTTRGGAILDPVTDKLFTLTVLGTFVVEDQLSLIQLAILLARDLYNSLAFAIARIRRLPIEFKARWSGKVVTFLQLATVPVILFASAWLPLMIGIVGVASLYSILDYSLAARSALRERRGHDGTALDGVA